MCSIKILYESGRSKAKGQLRNKKPAKGRVSWTWKVGTRTTPGRWKITVDCDKAGRGELRRVCLGIEACAALLALGDDGDAGRRSPGSARQGTMRLVVAHLDKFASRTVLRERADRPGKRSGEQC